MLSYCVTVFKTRHFEQENRLSKWLWLENQFFLCFNHLWHPFCMYLNMLWQFITSRGQNVAATFMHSVSQWPRAKLPQAPTPCVEAPWLSSILENCQILRCCFVFLSPRSTEHFPYNHIWRKTVGERQAVMWNKCCSRVCTKKLCPNALSLQTWADGLWG